MEGFRLDYSRLEQSRSWRMTAPLRDANLFAKRCWRRLRDVSSAVSYFPLAAATKAGEVRAAPCRSASRSEITTEGACRGLSKFRQDVARPGLVRHRQRSVETAWRGERSGGLGARWVERSRDDVYPFARRLHKELVSARAAADMFRRHGCARARVALEGVIDLQGAQTPASGTRRRQALLRGLCHGNSPPRRSARRLDLPERAISTGRLSPCARRLKA